MFFNEGKIQNGTTKINTIFLFLYDLSTQPQLIDKLIIKLKLNVSAVICGEGKNYPLFPKVFWLVKELNEHATD